MTTGEIQSLFLARMAALGPSPKWWQRSRRKRWKKLATVIMAEALRDTAILIMQMALDPPTLQSMYKAPIERFAWEPN